MGLIRSSNPRSLPSVVKWEYTFQHPVDDVWKMISNTDQMNRSRGQPPIDYRDEPLPSGKTRRIGKMKASGITFEWVEQPYEWLRPGYFFVQRDYSRGPFYEADSHWLLTPRGSGCHLTQTVSYRPEGSFGAQ